MRERHWVNRLLLPLALAPATAVAYLLDPVLPVGSLALVFITAVVWIAARTGVYAGLLAAVSSFLIYNFLFTEPRLTFHITNPDELATALFFLFVALIVGPLAGRLRSQLEAERRANWQTSALLELARSLSAASSTADVREKASECLHEWTGRTVEILDHAGQEREAAQPRSNMLREAASAMPVSRGQERVTLMMRESERPRVELLRPEADSSSWWNEPFRDAVCYQIEAAIDRARLANRLADARIAEETERLRSSLLSSISHDLRTPLSSMIGAASSLLSLYGRMSEEDRTSLLESILAEGQRLDRYIRNLLDMTRLGHGTLQIQRDWIAVTDLLASALRRTRAVLQHVDVNRFIDDSLPLLYVHPALIEQALVNILENAGRFAPPGSTVVIEAWPTGHSVVIAISDQGPGIPESVRERIFDRFFTGEVSDQSSQGTGLGLAISQGMVAAHRGQVRIVDPVAGVGARFEIELPGHSLPRDDQTPSESSE